MGTHQSHIILSEVIEGAARGQNPSIHLMTAFNIGLLPGRMRVAIENPGALSAVRRRFDGGGVGEFRAIIGQYDGEDRAEVLVAKPCLEELDPVLNAPGRVVVPEENGHIVADEAEGQENL